MSRVTINLNKARDITKQRLRKERAPLLLQLDVDYIRAQELGGDVAPIVQRKQELRDITKAVDDAYTIDGLKAIRVE